MRFDRDALVWMPAGAVGGFAFLTMLSIGPLLWPFLAALVYWAQHRTGGRGAYGLLVGAGLTIAGVCLPQAAFAGIGVFGLGIAAVGVAACLASHRGRAGAA